MYFFHIGLIIFRKHTYYCISYIVLRYIVYVTFFLGSSRKTFHSRVHDLKSIERGSLTCDDGDDLAGVGRAGGVQCVVRDGPASGVIWCVSSWEPRPQLAQKWGVWWSQCHVLGWGCHQRPQPVFTHLCSLFSSLTVPVILWCTSLVTSTVSHQAH